MLHNNVILISKMHPESNVTIITIRYTHVHVYCYKLRLLKVNNSSENLKQTLYLLLISS